MRGSVGNCSACAAFVYLLQFRFGLPLIAYAAAANSRLSTCVRRGNTRRQMNAENSFRYRDSPPVPVRIPIESVHSAAQIESSAYRIANEVAMLSGPQWHTFLTDLHLRI